tara:strand:+ start:129 stop:536 length:408 start_codon:yes stop_codon:yes gene_type:complete
MITYQNKTNFILQKEEKIFSWLYNVILEEKKQVGDIIYVFCGDEFLLKKNIQYLNHRTLTDVITFDYCKKNIVSGDILISIDRVKENAKLFNVSTLNELQRVMVHGLLHLLKYEDKNKTDAKLMRTKEDYYLSKI